MNDADASGTRPGEGAIRFEGAVRFSHSGYRYVLGYGTDFFGIWDREHAGAPILRFPRTDDGWDQAWYEYVSREKHNVEVLPPEAAFGPTRVRGRWTRGLLYSHVAGALVAAAVLAFGIARLAGVTEGPGGSIREIEEQIAGIFALLFFVGFYPVPAGIAWLLWQHRAHQNLASLGATQLPYTPGWSIAWWFVPFATFFMPYRMVRDLWKASDPNATGAEWKQGQTPRLLPLWWAAWLSSLVLLIIAAAIGREGDTSRLMTQAVLGIVTALLITVAGVLGAKLVRDIDVRQEQKRNRVGTSTDYVIRPPT